MSMFPLLTIEQANPLLYGAQKVNDIYARILQNHEQKIKNKYLPENLEGQNKELNLKNALSEGELAPKIAAAQYLPRQALANVIGQENINKYYGANIESEMALRNAEANYKGQESKFLPLKELIAATSAQQSGSRFGGAFQLKQMLSQMPAAQRTEWIAQNQDQYNQMINDLANKQLEKQETSGQAALNAMIAKTFGGGEPQVVQATPQTLAAVMQAQQGEVAPAAANAAEAMQLNRVLSQMPPAARNEWIAQNQGQYNAMVNGLGNRQQQAAPQQQMIREAMNPAAQQQAMQQQMAQQQMAKQVMEQQALAQQQAAPQQARKQFGTTPEQSEMLNLIAQREANRKQVTTKTNNRVDNAIIMEGSLMRDRELNAPRIKNAVEFAGLLGKGKRISSEWTNKNQDKIADYDWFTKSFIPNAANQIRQMEGLSSTDSQREELKELSGLSIDDIRSNPERALKYFNRAMRTVQNISDSVIDAGEPTHKGVTRKMAGIKKLDRDYTDVSDITDKQSANKGGYVTVVSPNGSTGVIPADKLDAAIKRGFKRV